MNGYSDSEVFRLLNQEKRDKKEKSIQQTINILNKNKIEYSNTHTPNVVSIKFKEDFIQLSLKKQGKKVKYCQNQIWQTTDLNILINQIKTK
jgi:hypothetical protein